MLVLCTMHALRFFNEHTYIQISPRMHIKNETWRYQQIYFFNWVIEVISRFNFTFWLTLALNCIRFDGFKSIILVHRFYSSGTLFSDRTWTLENDFTPLTFMHFLFLPNQMENVLRNPLSLRHLIGSWLRRNDRNAI